MNCCSARGKNPLAVIAAAALLAALVFSGCGPGSRAKTVKLDPANPVTVTVWHYYNGAVLNAFEEMVRNFNETLGKEQGIIVAGKAMGNTAELEKAVLAAINKEVGSPDIPNIFASYADTAYTIEKMGVLANLDDYLNEEDLAQYIESYINEGRIGLNGELRIFPIAKASETFMINETDWLPFAAFHNLSYNDLATIEGITRVAGIYHAATGKAFFGRDVLANFFIIASKEFGTELFRAEKGTVTVTINDEVMRKIWNNYYIPYISGHFSSYGRFRSDDVRVGDILAYIGSTSSAAFFPREVTVDGRSHPIAARVLPMPHFEGGSKVMVQQGAGMVITKSTPQIEYAGIVFLKWFTEAQNNIEFSALSAYMPVKKSAANYDVVVKTLEARGLPLDAVTNNVLTVALNDINNSELYTNNAFDHAAAARSVLERSLQNRAVTDRQSVDAAVEAGGSRDEALAPFFAEENFRAWLDDFKAELNEAVRIQQ